MDVVNIKERNWGIDLMRIVSMYMVVILHVLNRGGLLDNVVQWSAQYWLVWTMEICAFCATDIFALISGYVSYKSEAKPRRLIGIWLQTEFWGIVIIIVMFFLHAMGIGNITIGSKNIIKTILPVSTRAYWYVTGFFGMYLFMPVMNVAIERLDKSKLKVIIVSIVLLMIVNPFTLVVDPFHLQEGYSFVWLIIMYLVGAYIAKYQFFQKLSSNKWLMIYIVTILLLIGVKSVLQKLEIGVAGKALSEDILMSYVSPVVVLSAMAFLGIGVCGNIYNTLITKVIRYISPTVFGIYIIHTSPLVWDNLINGIVDKCADLNVIALFGVILGCTTSIFVICMILERLRIKVFALLHIDDICIKIEDILANIFHI